MQTDPFNLRLQAYQAWREQLASTVEQFQRWLEDNGLAEAEQELSLFEAAEALRKDRLRIAFVAEFSRGKTELINALFFAHYGQRLLPSEAGRTTMCPTELFYDHEADQAYIRLLPIETRAEDRSIADFKHEPIHWTQTLLDTESPAQLAQALQEVIRTKQVSLSRARELGLYDEHQDPYFKAHGRPPEQVEIPYWRHALISFPHELLKRGLVVLDTPGLNALGTEPELTLNMLPAAQAVLFILGADTGVTRSDMEVWQHHVRGLREQRDKGLIVALNKIDTLWDDLKQPAAVAASIESQCRASAEQLQIAPQQVFPISAQKGLLAKVRDDERLLAASRLGDLERFLSDEILPARQSIVQENLVAQVGGMIDQQISVLKSRSVQMTRQLTELRSLRGKNADVIMHLMSKSREEQAAYLRNVESFQASRRLLQSQARNMLDALSMDTLDRLIHKTREDMTHSWTTAGLKRGMETFFDGARDIMEQVSAQAEQTRMLIRATYRKFHEEHGLPAITPRQFSTAATSTELERLYQEAEAFRRSPVTAMTEQKFVIKKFFIGLVSHTRSLFFKANQDANIWLKDVMNPLVKQIKEHKSTMEKRLETLRRISESRDTLEVRLKELDSEHRTLKQQLQSLEHMRETLDTPPEQATRPRAQPSGREEAVV